MTTKVVESKVVSGDAPEGATVMDVMRPYSMHVTGRIVPRVFAMRWERVDGGEWELIRLSVSGPKLKKNGEVGMSESTTSFVQYGRTWQAITPNWLTAELNRWRP